MTGLSETVVETRRIVYPADANHLETAQGGRLLGWMEQIASWSAMRFAGTTTLTVSVEGASIDRPVPQGDLVAFDAYVYDAGETSVRTRVRSYHEDPFSGDRDLAAEARMVLVAVDEDGSPVEVPDLHWDSDEEARLRDAALSGG